MGSVRKPITSTDLQNSTSQRNNSQWAPIKDLARSPVVLGTLGAMSALPPITPWTAALKGIGIVATTALLGDMAVDSLRNAVTPPVLDKNPSPKSPFSPNSPSGGLDYPSTAKAKSDENQSKLLTPPSSLPSGGSLLEVLSMGSVNTNKTLSNGTEVLGSHLGFANEQFGALLLYMDILVTSVSQISDSLQIMASASIDSANVVSNKTNDLERLANNSDYLKNIADSADSSKTRNDFLMTPQTVHDLEGNSITSGHPEQLKAEAHANATKFHSDTNNDSYDVDDIPFLDLLPIIPFVGVSSSFDKSIPILQNPFTAKNL